MACRIGDTVCDPLLHVACGYFPIAIEMLLEHGFFEDWPLSNPNLRQDSHARQQSVLENQPQGGSVGGVKGIFLQKKKKGYRNGSI